MEKFVDVLGRIAVNAYAFMLFVLAGAIAIVAHYGRDKDLAIFAGSVATTAAALFHGGEKK